MFLCTCEGDSWRTCRNTKSGSVSSGAGGIVDRKVLFHPGGFWEESLFQSQRLPPPAKVGRSPEPPVAGSVLGMSWHWHCSQCFCRQRIPTA